MTPAVATEILAFRRSCAEPVRILELLAGLPPVAQQHLAIAVLDTLFLRQSIELPEAIVRQLFGSALDVLGRSGEHQVGQLVQGLTSCQAGRAAGTAAIKEKKRQIAQLTEKLETELTGKVSTALYPLPAAAGGDYAISLTTFPARIRSLHLVILSLLAQVRRPKEIHLTVGQDEFKNKSFFPTRLLDLQAYGLVINLVQKTAHQYDKYLFNHALNANRPFVIVDDDVIYNATAMGSLLDEHHRHPDCVVANRCHLIRLGADGNPLPYESWQREVYHHQPSYLLMPTGAGGVLYPPGFFDADMAANPELILGHAPYADDVWLKASALAKGMRTKSTDVVTKGLWYQRYTPTMIDGALHKTNVDRGLNDIQWHMAMAYLESRGVNWRGLLQADLGAEA